MLKKDLNNLEVFPESLSKRVSFNYSRKYLILFAGLGFFASLLLGFLMREFLVLPTLTSAFWLCIGAAILALILVFQNLFVCSTQTFLWASVVEAFGLSIFLFKFFHPWTVFALVALLATVLFGHREAHRDLNDRVKVRIQDFIRKVLIFSTRATAIFFALFLLGIYVSNGISRPAFDFFVEINKPTLEPFLGPIDLNLQANDFFTEVAKEQINRQFSGTEQFQHLASEGGLEEAYVGAGRELRNQVVEVTKLPVRADESASEYFYRLSSEKLPKPGTNNQLGFLGFMVVMVLVVYWALMFFLTIARILILSPLSWLIYRILAAMGVVYIERVMAEKEELTIK